MRKDQIILFIASFLLISFVINVGINTYNNIKFNALYEQAEAEINEDIKLGMSRLEINDIIKVGCERYMKTQSDEYYCIRKYKSEN